MPRRSTSNQTTKNLQQNPFDNEESLEKASGPLNRAILDHRALSFTTRMDRGLTVEHAEVDVTFTHERWGDLHITLISPDGTRSVLADRIGKVPGSGASDTGSDKSGTLSFRFMTTNSWGEDSGGVWRLEVKDQATGKTGTLTDWGLRLYGRKDETDDIYVYTDEYSSQSGWSRGRLADRDGGTDTINAAALSVDSTINLRTGHATLGGRSLTIETPRNIENVFTGDGDDTLVGNAAANMLYAGRGANTMTGNGGADSFMVRMRSGGHDTVTDFSSADGDQIVLIGPDPIDFSQLTITDQADGALVTVPFGDGAGNTIKLKGIRASSLNEDSFGFRFHVNYPFDDSDEPVLPRIDGDSGANEIIGTDVGEIITGYAGDDVIRGRGGDDTLQGGPGVGTDRLFGDEGEDTLLLEGGLATVRATKITHNGKNTSYALSFGGSYASGGTESDMFVITKAGEHSLSNFIIDFNKNGESDKIDLSRFPIFSPRDIKIEERNIPGAQLLCISFNGMNLATLMNVRKSDFDVSSIIFADPGQTMPNGEEGSLGPISPFYPVARTIGDAGANELSGDNPAGSSLKGRTSDDTYTIKFSGDTVVENKDEGYDTVRSEFSYTLPEHVEKLVLTGVGAINGTGNNLVNRLEGNNAANRLDGREGSDQMIGKGGDDTYVVDSNGDRVIEQANEGTDTVEASVSFVLPEHVENLILTGTEAINATGNRANNILTGNAAANTMDGQRGNDILAGKEGGDLYLFDRKSGVDTIQENDATPDVTDTLQFSASIHHDQIRVERRDDDLELSVIGTTDKVIIDDWYLGRQHHVEKIISGDGWYLVLQNPQSGNLQGSNFSWSQSESEVVPHDNTVDVEEEEFQAPSEEVPVVETRQEEKTPPKLYKLHTVSGHHPQRDTDGDHIYLEDRYGLMSQRVINKTIHVRDDIGDLEGDGNTVNFDDGDNSATFVRGNNNTFHFGDGQDNITSLEGDGNTINFDDGGDDVNIEGDRNTINFGNGDDSAAWIVGNNNAIHFGDGGGEVGLEGDSNTVYTYGGNTFHLEGDKNRIVYSSSSQGQDQIHDFEPAEGDKIEYMSAVGEPDLIFSNSGPNPFSVWMEKGGWATTLYMDKDGDASADIEIELLGVTNFTEYSLIL